ncbi:ABC transporter permease [Fictibacillus sp. BK138]|uniref:ABC transporter permease n=1 Tax=Fictibacillus sp. BK138 TaxID=2512121 RepID=UPI0010296BEF|nr:ABC-2 family transporter protein [Fictibacillus sp. BK138]RZT21792.1 ABC-2 type transport system permease protein [Fictibacillus sp. BK138]
MRKYIEFARVQMQVHAAYSAWFWANTFSVLLRMLVIYFFWKAVYSNRSEIEGMSFDGMTTYIIIAMFLQMFVSGVGRELAHTIKDGNVAIELMRPYHLITRLIAMDIGDKVIYFIRGALPLGILAFVFMDVTLPSTWQSGVLFLLSALMGIWIGTFFDLLIAILAFWTINLWGLEVMKEAVVSFFSGALVPLILFPEWFQTISLFLPFQAMVYVPVAIYTGILTGTEAWLAVGSQLIWAVLLFGLLRVLWSVAMKKVTIFGG